MATPGDKKDIISRLQKDILLWEGFVPPPAGAAEGVVSYRRYSRDALPTREQQAATSGLLGGLLTALMRQGGPCLWISRDRRLFPPAMDGFEVEPDRMIFIDVGNEKDVLWAMEEALKCEGLAAVVAEVKEISFAQSRRLQLAVESSRVTGFLLR